MKLSPEQIMKLKVPEIKEELKQRGLDHTGTKGHLISRLIASTEAEAESETETPALTKEGSEGEPADEPAPAEETPKEEKTEEAAKTATVEEDGEIKPKHTPIVYNIPNKDSAAVKADEEAKKRRRAERFGTVDVPEHETKKLKARSERFDLKFSESETDKAEMRAKRFAQSLTSESEGKKNSGGVIDLSHIVTSSSMTEEEKKKRRAERFGASKN